MKTKIGLVVGAFLVALAGLLFCPFGQNGCQAKDPAGLKGETKLVVNSVKNVNAANENSRQEVKFTVYSEYWEAEDGTKYDLYQPGMILVTGEPTVNEGLATLASLGAIADDANDTTFHNGKAYTATFGRLVHQERYFYEALVNMVRPTRGGVAEVTYQDRPNCLLWEEDAGVACYGVTDAQAPAVNGFSLVWGAYSPRAIGNTIGGTGTYGNPAAPATQGYAGVSAEVIIAWKSSAGNPESYFKVYEGETPGTSFSAWTDALPNGVWNFNLYQMRVCEDGQRYDPTPSSFAARGGTVTTPE